MTLCIAAVCYEKKDLPRLVVSTDWKHESGFASAENQDKLAWIREDWPVLMAGTMTRAVHLKDTYRTFLDKKSEELKTKYRSEIIDTLNQPLTQFKHKLADVLIGSVLGISYDAFLTAGKSYLPETAFNELFSAVKRIRMDCQLILPLFIKGDPFIFRVNDEELEYCDNFAAIGSGMDIAEAVLSQRKQDEECSLAKTIYHIFEAGKIVSLAPPPGVGKDHTIVVFYPPTEGRTVAAKEISTKGYRFLEEKFRAYGPRRVGSFTLEDAFLEDADFGSFSP